MIATAGGLLSLGTGRLDRLSSLSVRGRKLKWLGLC